MDAKFVQSANALASMLVALSGMLMLVSPVQSANALRPMLVTLLPMLTLVRLLQSVNAKSPMLVTLSGMVMSPLAPGPVINSAPFLLSNSDPIEL